MSEPLVSDERIDELFGASTIVGLRAKSMRDRYEAELAKLRAQVERARRWLPESVLDGEDDDE